MFGLYDVFETGPDEWLFVSIVSEHHWPALCRAIDAPELLADERFETNVDRLAHDETLYERVQDALRGRDRTEVVEALVQASVPVATVNAPSDLIDDAHLNALDLLVDSRFEEGRVRAMLTPLRGDDIETRQRRSPPAIGADTREVLEAFGLGPRLAELEATGAFGDAFSGDRV